MEADKNANTSDSKSNKGSEPSPLQTEFKSGYDSAKQKDDTSTQQNNPTIIIQQENREGYWNKWIDPLVIFTFLLFIATGLLFWQASNDSRTTEKAAIAAKESADAAKNAVKIQKDYNEKSLALQKTSLDSSAKANSKAYDLNKLSLDSGMANNRKLLNQQIKSLNETKTEFEKEHQGFIEIDNLKMSQLAPSTNLVFYFEIKNLGIQPVRLDSMGTDIVFTDSITGGKEDTVKSEIDFVKTVMYPIHHYVSQIPINQHLPFPQISEYIYNQLQQKKFKIFVGGIIKFTNLVTNKKNKYSFYIMMDAERINEGHLESRYLVSENIELP